MQDRSYTIGEFARLVGISPRTVDFYTRSGLLHPEQPRQGHGYRHYREKDRQRVALIKQLQSRKFSLQEIRRVLDGGSPRDGSSPVEAMERVTMDLDKLRDLVRETRSHASAADPPALRAVAAEALQKAMGLCSVLVTFLQDAALL